MALQNEVQTKPVTSGNGTRRKYTVSLSDLTGLGAFTSGDVILADMPPGSIIAKTFVKPTIAVTGVGTAVGYLKTANHNYGSTSFDLKAAVAEDQSDLYATAQKENFSTATPLLFHVIVDTTLDAVTAGNIEAWVDYMIFS